MSLSASLSVAALVLREHTARLEQPSGLPVGVYTVECSVLLTGDIIQHQYAEPSSKSRDGVVDQGDVPMRLRARGCSDQNVVS